MSAADPVDVWLPPQTSALHLVRSPRPHRLLRRLLTITLVLVVGALFVPWVQTSVGKGRVVAYAPVERRQLVDTPTDGRVVRWHVQEGSRVKKGDPLVDLTDNDPDIMVRLRAEREAVVARGEAAKARATAIDERLASLQEARGGAVSAAQQRIRMASQRERVAEQAVEAAQAAEKAARLNHERQRDLESRGLASRRALELAELDLARASTELERARAALLAAESEELAVRGDLMKISSDGSALIEDARAAHAAARSEEANAAAELQRIEVRLARQSAQAVTAPTDGVVLSLKGGQGGEQVKAGDPLLEIVPDAEQRAVELWVRGNDVPLVSEGRSVRLQFEGWPAVQFSGWPSVAVGTFGGTVALVDATDDGQGQFRILVVPAPGETWPDARFLRQGSRANGWVLLDTVPLGWELWRQFNGFPPSMDVPAPGAAAEKKK